MMDEPISKLSKNSKNWEEIRGTLKNKMGWPKSKVTKEFLDLVETDFIKKDKFVKDYAAQLKMTTNGLFKNCKSIIEVSPRYCIQARRMREVCKILLKEPQKQMNRIAEDLNMDEYHFSKFVKNHTGQNFTNFRRGFFRTK